MKSVLITGVSSGIGNTLTKLLIKKGFKVWGVARRKKLLEGLKKELQNDNFFYTIADVIADKFWDKLVVELNQNKFTPDIIILNAAIHKNDLEKEIDLKVLRNTMEINFFSILTGVKVLSEKFTDNLHFITISSTSAFKGNHEEGIGYSASKGALSVAFESLYQKYLNSRLQFSTIFLGPVNTDMVRVSSFPLMLSQEKVAGYILAAIYQKKPFYYYPQPLFTILSIMRLLPNQVFFQIWKRLQKSYIKKREK